MGEAGKGAVKFGTDGWRGIIADDFTHENVRVAARAIAHYVLAHEDASAGVAIGYDTRFGSRRFAQVVAEVLSGAGIPVILADAITPTPALSWSVRTRGLAGGVMITSSHNPPEWNGVKYKASYGGSGKPSIIASIETYLDEPLAKATVPAPITEADLTSDYVAAIERFVDLPAIKASGYRFLIDTMYGAGRGVLAGIFTRAGIPFVEMRAEINPAFPGINPSRFCRTLPRRSGAWLRKSVTRDSLRTAMRTGSAPWMSMATWSTRTRSFRSCWTGCCARRAGRAM